MPDFSIVNAFRKKADPAVFQRPDFSLPEKWRPAHILDGGFFSLQQSEVEHCSVLNRLALGCQRKILTTKRQCWPSLYTPDKAKTACLYFCIVFDVTARRFPCPVQGSTGEKFLRMISLMQFSVKKVCFIALLLAGSLTAPAQQENGEEPRPNKFFAGGNFGLSLGRYTLVNLNPQVGYRFNRFLSAGMGLNLVYASQKERDPVTRQDYRKLIQGITGLNTFIRFYPTQRFLVQVQPEANYIFGKQIFYQPVKETYKLDAEIIPSLLVGGGMATPTANGAVLFTVMFDVLQNPNAPYGSRPIVNVGYNFNF